MSNYLIELSVIHTALFIGYWIFLRKEQQYAKMRFYLIASTLLALAIPLLKLPKLLFAGNDPVDVAPVASIPMDDINISAAAEPSVWGYDLLIYTYIAISAALLFKFLSGVFYLLWLARKSSHHQVGDLNVRKINHIKGSFTFFNWIFLSNEIDPARADYAVILKHEKAHVSLGHTYDLIFFELFKTCFWWLPTAWIVIKEVKKIHEYQADAAALKSCDVDQYSTILISSTLTTNGLSVPGLKRPSIRHAGLASSFHEGLILKRLKAMKQQAKNLSPWKMGALAALCTLLFIAFACSEEADREIQEIGSKSNNITFDQLPPSMQRDLGDIQDELSFLKVNISEDDEISSIKELQDLDPKLIHAMNVDKINGAVYIAVKKDGANFDYLSDKSKIDGGVFTIVEAQPEFEGGIGGFRSYIANEIRYPLQARQSGVEGRVDVQFVVEQDGSLSAVKAIKGIGSGCDEEAERVVRNAPRFKPGRQNGKPVRVRMVVPITFELNEAKTNPDNSVQGIVVIEEVQAQNEKFSVDADYANGEWSGTVYDEQGNGLPGVNILVVGTTTGTVSGLDGAFKLKADQTQELALSFVGYQTLRLSGK